MGLRTLPKKTIALLSQRKTDSDNEDSRITFAKDQLKLDQARVDVPKGKTFVETNAMAILLIIALVWFKFRR